MTCRLSFFLYFIQTAAGFRILSDIAETAKNRHDALKKQAHKAENEVRYCCFFYIYFFKHKKTNFVKQVYAHTVMGALHEVETQLPGIFLGFVSLLVRTLFCFRFLVNDSANLWVSDKKRKMTTRRARPLLF